MVKTKRQLVGLVLVASLVVGVLLPPVVAAQQPVEPIDPGQVQPLPQVLELLAGPVGWVALGTLLSMWLAHWEWYNAQVEAIKRLLPVVLSASLSIAARLLLLYVPAEVWEALAPYWFIVMGTALTWLGSQAWYQLAYRVRDVGSGRTWTSTRVIE